MRNFPLFPSQIALMLGVDQRQILEWVMEEKLKAKKDSSHIWITTFDLIDFLSQNLECVGRLYCDNPVNVYQSWNQEIIEELENRWPTEPLKSETFSD